METSYLLYSVNVHIPKDRITQAHQGYGFIEFLSEEDADYAMKIMNMIKLYGKPIRVNKVIQNVDRQRDKQIDMLLTSYSISAYIRTCRYKARYTSIGQGEVYQYRVGDNLETPDCLALVG